MAYHDIVSDLTSAELYFQAMIRLDELKKRLTEVGAHDLVDKIKTAKLHLEVVARKMEKM